jgi:hypothetical protein
MHRDEVSTPAPGDISPHFRAAPESPEAIAERLFPDTGTMADYMRRTLRGVVAGAIRADREAFAAWCDEQATGAETNADTFDARGDAPGAKISATRHEGRAAACRAVAARLRGVTS